MSLPKILVVNTVCPNKNCGIHQHGLRFFRCLGGSSEYEFIYCEANSYNTLPIFDGQEYQATIFNYLPYSCSWQISTKDKSLGKRIAIAHECSQAVIDGGSDNRFDLWIVADPSITEKGTNYRTIPRPLATDIQNKPTLQGVVRVGSFGFPFPQKNYPGLIEAVCLEFDEAIISIHMPQAEIAAVDMSVLIQDLNRRITKPGVSLEITQDFIDDITLVERLSHNHINVFLYRDDLRAYPKELSGVSSALDYAIPAGRPILVSDSVQFRHVRGILPIYSQCYLKQVIETGERKVEFLGAEWSQQEHRRAVEQILREVLN